MTGPLAMLLAGERRAQRRLLVRAALLAALVASASVLLLGLSGWFITAGRSVGVTLTVSVAWAVAPHVVLAFTR